MSDLDERIKLFYRKKMQQNKLKEKIMMLSKMKDKKSQIALQKLQKKLKHEFIVSDRNLIIKNEMGEEIENINRNITTYISETLQDINNEIKLKSMDDITKKYDILFEFQDIAKLDENAMLQEIENREMSLKSLFQAKKALYDYQEMAVRNIENEINNINTSLSVLCETLKTEESKSEKAELLKSYNDHYARLFEMKEKLLELNNIPEVQYTAIHK